MSLKIGKRAITVAMSVAPVVGAVAAKAFVDFQNGAIGTTEYEIKSRHVPKSLDGFRIVEIADLHDATFGFQNERLAAVVAAAKPDLIVLAGDMIHKDTISNAMAFIRHATSMAPVVFAPGDHESYSSRYPEFRRQLVQAGVYLLEDDVVTGKELGISKPTSTGFLSVAPITVVGVADPLFSPWLDRAEPGKLMDRKLGELLSKAQDQENDARWSGPRPFRLLVAHRPEHFASYAREGVDLVLSGHAHGGQWRLPVIGGLYAPSQGILPKYTSGMHEEGNARMVISRGLGNSGFPLRLNNRPEVVVVTLRSDSSLPSLVDFRRKVDLRSLAEDVVTNLNDGDKGLGLSKANNAKPLKAEAGKDVAAGQGSVRKSSTKEFLKSTAKDVALQEAPHVMQEIIAALTPLVVSALVGKTFLAGKGK